MRMQVALPFYLPVNGEAMLNRLLIYFTFPLTLA